MAVLQRTPARLRPAGRGLSSTQRRPVAYVRSRGFSRDPNQTVSVGTATETDSAFTLGLVFDQTIAVGTATEVDTGQGVSVSTTSGSSVGAQGGLAWLFTGTADSQIITVGTALESDSAFVASVTTPSSQTVVVGTALETDTAPPIAPPSGQTIAVGTALEVDTTGVVYCPEAVILVRPEFLPAGTEVGAYRRFEWLGSELARRGAGPGPAVATTTVRDDLLVAFTDLEDGEWVLYSPAYPNRRLFFMVGQP